MRYSKPALTISEQVLLLAQRGLSIPNTNRAEHYLATIGYYRFSAYALPFEQTHTPESARTHHFQPETQFDHILGLYIFDRKLRLMVMEAVERVEVAVRSTWAQAMATRYGTHAHMDALLFKSPWQHTQDLSKVATEIYKSSDSSVVHYRSHYAEPFLPPIWVIAEAMTLGALSRWVSNSKDNSAKKVTAQTLGMPTVEVLEQVLHALTPVRNACAHHSRLWNRRVPMSLPHIKRYQADLIHPSSPHHQAHHLYNYLTVLAIMMKTMNPTGTWRARLSQLITQELAPHLLPAMGFPADWQSRPIWQGASP